MNLVNIESINLIPQMLEKLEQLNNQILELKQQLKPKYDLTKRSNVLKYLEISESTLSKYIREGILIQGYHFHRHIKNNKSIILYVSGAIEEFKKERNK